MADVASRNLDTSKVLQGRLCSCSSSDGTDKKLTIDNLGVELAADISETVNYSETQLEDYSNLKRVISREVTARITISEVDTTDIGTVNAAANDTLVVSTDDGGTNGNGVTLTIADADSHEAHIEGNKTVWVFTKRTSGTTLGYSIVSNA